MAAHASMQEFLSRNNLLMASPLSGTKFRKIQDSKNLHVRRSFASMFDKNSTLARSTAMELKPTSISPGRFHKYRSEDSMQHLANMAEFVRKELLANSNPSNTSEDNKENRPPGEQTLPKPVPRVSSSLIKGLRWPCE